MGKSIQCLGVIIDGNRRYARAKKLPSLAGHKLGAEKLLEFLGWCETAGVKTVIVYAFSTENWRRSPVEVRALMLLLKKFLRTEIANLTNRSYRLRVIGQRHNLPPAIQRLIVEAEEKTSTGKKGRLVLAISYGGRAEIIEAVNKIKAKKLSKPLTEKKFSDFLWTAGLPDPDLVIRTGGERRLSNFLTWQMVYSELFFTDTLWPALTKKEFEQIIGDFYRRERRYGK